MVGHRLLLSSLLSLALLAACYEVSDRAQIRSNAAEDSTIDISPSLVQRFARTNLDPEHREAVIVTLAPGTDTQSLQAAGMHIEHAMKNKSIVSGTLNADAFNKLRSLPGVDRIEPDGAMKALDP